MTHQVAASTVYVMQLLLSRKQALHESHHGMLWTPCSCSQQAQGAESAHDSTLWHFQSCAEPLLDSNCSTFRNVLSHCMTADCSTSKNVLSQRMTAHRSAHLELRIPQLQQQPPIHHVVQEFLAVLLQAQRRYPLAHLTYCSAGSGGLGQGCARCND